MKGVDADTTCMSLPHTYAKCVRGMLAAFLVVATAFATGALHAAAATSTIVVSMEVQSATTLVQGCVAGGTGADLGQVLPGSSAVTTADCSIQFGSSNNTSMIQIWQQDRGGRAMFAQPRGDMVSSFGTSGIATWDVPGGGDLEKLMSMAMMPDGSGRFYALLAHSTTEAALARFQADGTLDTAFSSGDGTDGFLLFSDSVAPDNWSRIAVQNDGRIVVAAWASAADPATLVRRFLATGDVDNSFGTGGTLIHNACDPDAASNSEWMTSMMIDDRGRILLSGTCEITVAADSSWIVMRVTSDGRVDTTFAGDGVFDWNGNAGWEPGDGGIVVQPDGKILIAGESRPGGNSRATVVRLLDDGTPDPGFDGGSGNLWAGNGYVAYASGVVQNQPRALALDGTGRIIVTQRMGGGTDATTDTGVLRLTSDGSRDVTWDTDGWSTHAFVAGGKDEPGKVLAWPDGSLTIIGTLGADVSRDAFVARLTPSATLDTRFSSDGIASWEVQAGFGNRANLGVLALDGRLLIGGTADRSGTDSTAAFYQLDAVTVDDYLDLGGGSDRDWSSAATTNMFGMCLRQVGGGASQSAFTVDAGADCAATDADEWYAIPQAPGASAKLATLPTSLETGTVMLRFGLRASTTQAPGGYVAPVTFQVVAPNA